MCEPRVSYVSTTESGCHVASTCFGPATRTTAAWLHSNMHLTKCMSCKVPHETSYIMVQEEKRRIPATS